MLVVEWGQGRQEQRLDESQLDLLLDHVAADASREGKPQCVQVTVEGAGTLGIVVGSDWSFLHHVPPDLKPPYTVSVGPDQDEAPVVCYVAGDHYTETLRRNTVSPEAARAAMRHFIATGELSPDVGWDEV